ncbi:MAG TPA: response regulator transcription factor [Saprospiraceae bacterium]|nr:response regulator transcription factor [Saprospiraceae bacterium]
MQAPKRKILLVDDDDAVLEFLSYNLIRKNFEVQVASNGQEALDKAKPFQPDIIILDWMMPEMDGITTCRKFREDPDYNETIITFLTAKDDDFSRIEGFDAGADDYIHKSIKPLVFIAKVEALLRRKGKIVEDSGNILFQDLSVNPHKRRVQKKGQKIELTKIEYNLLLLFLSDKTKIFSREEIYKIIWGEDIIVGDRTLDVHIRNLRKKIGYDMVATHKGQGYSMTEE